MRPLLALAAALLLASAPAAAGPLLTAVVPDLPGPGPGDEAFAIGCDATCDLRGWTVTDGEGTHPLPPLTLAPGEEAWFVGDEALWEAFGMPAAVGTFEKLRLGNRGDQLRLDSPDTITADAFVWGDETDGDIRGRLGYTSPGLVYRRLAGSDGWIDTDHVDDWRTPRTHRVGESSLDAPVFTVSRTTLYSSPDSSFDVLRGLVGDAQERVHLHVYELRSRALVEALSEAGGRGVDLQVLVDGSPVGLREQARSEVAHGLQRILDAGGQAWLAGNDRYDHHHLKVLVVDDAVAVQSENWVASGVPEDPSWGNRGWGIVLHDRVVADWFAAWMADDRAAWDTSPFDLATFAPAYQEPPRFHPRSGTYGPAQPAVALETTVTVRPAVAPDHVADPVTDPIAAVVADARERLWVQQLDLSTQASNRLGFEAPDPLLVAIAAAAAGGADVVVQAAAPFSRDDAGNTEAMAALAAAGPVQAGLLERPGIATLHNKGVIADDTVVIGSINGNHHSRSENREVSLIVSGPGVAGFYADLFAADQGQGLLTADAPAPWSIPGPPLPILLALVLVLATRPWRRW